MLYVRSEETGTQACDNCFRNDPENGGTERRLAQPERSFREGSTEGAEKEMKNKKTRFSREGWYLPENMINGVAIVGMFLVIIILNLIKLI